MKAHAYAERYDQTLFSKEPTTYYVLDFPLFLGGQTIRTTNLKNFQGIIKEEEAKGTRINSDRLPLFTRGLVFKTLEGRTPDKTISPMVIRTPFNKVS